MVLGCCYVRSAEAYNTDGPWHPSSLHQTANRSGHQPERALLSTRRLPAIISPLAHTHQSRLFSPALTNVAAKNFVLASSIISSFYWAISHSFVVGSYIMVAAKGVDVWPNDAGFDTTYEENEPVELTVKGVIPPYVAGVLCKCSNTLVDVC